MKVFIIAAMASALAFTPASAKTKAVAKTKPTACTAENMAKTTGGMQTMPYSPGRMAMDKEMAAVNTEMSKGNMRAACARYANVQKMSSAK
jgi:hypothetical protein